MMTTATEPTADRPVRKSITVKASTDRAFRVFSEGIDTWWPRTHHIGKSPMKKVIIEVLRSRRAVFHKTDRRHGLRLGPDIGLGTTESVRYGVAGDHACPWGYEPDVTKSSEVECSLHAGGGWRMTRVDLERSIPCAPRRRLGGDAHGRRRPEWMDRAPRNSFARVERRRNESQDAVSNRGSVVRALRGGDTYGFLSFKAPDASRGGGARRQWIVYRSTGSATWGGFFMGFGLVISAYFAFLRDSRVGIG